MSLRGFHVADENWWTSKLALNFHCSVTKASLRLDENQWSHICLLFQSASVNVTICVFPSIKFVVSTLHNGLMRRNFERMFCGWKCIPAHWRNYATLVCWATTEDTCSELCCSSRSFLVSFSDLDLLSPAPSIFYRNMSLSNWCFYTSVFSGWICLSKLSSTCVTYYIWSFYIKYTTTFMLGGDQLEESLTLEKACDKNRSSHLYLFCYFRTFGRCSW